MKDCNKFDTGMAEPKLENLWSNPFVFSSTIKYLKYKKNPLKLLDNGGKNPQQNNGLIYSKKFSVIVIIF